MVSSLLQTSTDLSIRSLSPVVRSTGKHGSSRSREFHPGRHGFVPSSSIFAIKLRGLQGWFEESKSILPRNLIRASDSSLGSDEAPEPDASLSQSTVVGEDAAVFDLSKQRITSWVSFSVVLGVVLAILNYVWIDPKTGYGNAFVQAMSSLSDNHEQ
ncbi:hypothetical protein L7F22_049393 [Adiantum nelumboides]|nr:hypothetical protein [Adiantum nelumboides]